MSAPPARKRSLEAGSSTPTASTFTRPRTRKQSRVSQQPPLLLAISTDLLDYILSFLWPDDLGSLVRACAACTQMHERLEVVGWLVVERLGLRRGEEDLGFCANPRRTLCDRMSRLAAQADEARAAVALIDSSRREALGWLKLLDRMLLAEHAKRLLSLLQRASDSNTRTLVVHTLRPLGSRWNGKYMVGALAPCLRDDNHWARFAALRTLETCPREDIAPHHEAIVAQLGATGFDVQCDRMVRRTALDELRRACRRPWAASMRVTLAAALPLLRESSDPVVVDFAQREVTDLLRLCEARSDHMASKQKVAELEAELAQLKQQQQQQQQQQPQSQQQQR